MSSSQQCTPLHNNAACTSALEHNGQSNKCMSRTESISSEYTATTSPRLRPRLDRSKLSLDLTHLCRPFGSQDDVHNRHHHQTRLGYGSSGGGNQRTTANQQSVGGGLRFRKSMSLTMAPTAYGAQQYKSNCQMTNARISNNQSPPPDRCRSANQRRATDAQQPIRNTNERFLKFHRSRRLSWLLDTFKPRQNRKTEKLYNCNRPPGRSQSQMLQYSTGGYTNYAYTTSGQPFTQQQQQQQKQQRQQQQQQQHYSTQSLKPCGRSQSSNVLKLDSNTINGSAHQFRFVPRTNSRLNGQRLYFQSSSGGPQPIIYRKYSAGAAPLPPLSVRNHFGSNVAAVNRAVLVQSPLPGLETLWAKEK